MPQNNKKVNNKKNKKKVFYSGAEHRNQKTRSRINMYI
jgi:hypothetical protein